MPVVIGELEISPAPASVAPAAAAPAGSAAPPRESDPATLAAARRLHDAQGELNLRLFAH